VIKSTRSLLDRLLRPDDPQTDQATDDALKLAVAALLVEVVQADFETSIVEREQVLGSLALLLELDPDARAALLELASREIDQAHDLHQFTSRVNEGFTPERKLLLLEQLWRVARADQRVHKYEEHLIRRIADLLHVPHSAFITAKLRSERPA
jgi:uncharacterized tellurite resistance protein B-like protein